METTMDCIQQGVLTQEEKIENNGFFSVNKRMLPGKLSYFFFFASFGSYLPFLNVFFTSIGLKASQAGFIAGLRATASSIASPLWGVVADKTGRRKMIFVIICIGTLLFVFPMPWIAKSVRNIKYRHNSQQQLIIQNDTNASTYLPSSKSCKLDLNTNNLFYVMLTIAVLASLFDTTIPGFIDSAVMNAVSKSKRKATFGKQRLFGSVGFGITSVIVGICADHYESQSLSSYTPAFFVFLPAILILIPVGCMLLNLRESQNTETRHANRHVLKDVVITCFKLDNFLFLLTIVIMGIANGILYGFLFLLMNDEMSGTKTTMGVCTATAILAETIMFPYCSKIIKILGGPIPAIIMGVFSYFVRFLLTSYVQNAWLILPIQLLHCVGWALFWSAAVEHTHAISKSEISTSMFGILNGLHFGIGGLIANMIGGVVYEKYKGRILFRGASVIYAGWSLCMILYCYIRNRLKNKMKSPEDHKTSKQKSETLSMIDKN